MTTKLVKWASNDGQIIKSGLSDGYGGKAITTAAHLDYDRHGFEGYPGNVGLAERGIDTCHETVRYWWDRFGLLFAAEIRKRRVQQH